MPRFLDFPDPPPVMWRPSDFDRAIRRLTLGSVLFVSACAGWFTGGAWIADGKPDRTPYVRLPETGR